MNQSTVWDIQQKLNTERKALEALQVSNAKWRDITDNLCPKSSSLSTLHSEWRARYENQCDYNRSLFLEAQRLSQRIRLLKSGQQDAILDATEQNKSRVEWKREIRKYDIEKLSLTSKLVMYERQLDSEAMAYYKVRDALLLLASDVNHQASAWIKQQEDEDSNKLTRFKQGPLKFKTLRTAATFQHRHGRTTPRRSTLHSYKKIHLAYKPFERDSTSRQSADRHSRQDSRRKR